MKKFIERNGIAFERYAIFTIPYVEYWNHQLNNSECFALCNLIEQAQEQGRKYRVIRRANNQVALYLEKR